MCSTLVLEVWYLCTYIVIPLRIFSESVQNRSLPLLGLPCVGVECHLSTRVWHTQHAVETSFGITLDHFYGLVAYLAPLFLLLRSFLFFFCSSRARLLALVMGWIVFFFFLLGNR